MTDPGTIYDAFIDLDLMNLFVCLYMNRVHESNDRKKTGQILKAITNFRMRFYAGENKGAILNKVYVMHTVCTNPYIFFYYYFAIGKNTPPHYTRICVL